MSLNKTAISKKSDLEVNNINQGDCVQLINNKDLFQVIGVDSNHKKCWVRRWPLLTNGSPVFEIPINEVVISTV
tara:strand:+ start:219 stop:440 length:222 start_codon:yes stop_codon:yes gene_type:complete